MIRGRHRSRLFDEDTAPTFNLRSLTAIALLGALGVAACNGSPPDLTEAPCAAALGDGARAICTLRSYPDRPYEVMVPEESAESPFPVLLLLHGGGGEAEGALRSACPTGDTENGGCLHHVAEREGFVLVAPNGTGAKLAGEMRTWNAGGGSDGWRCVSGRACEEGIDDISYLGAVLDDVSEHVSIDSSRIYATGLSNGGAMSYRLACEMSDRIAAIVPIGGAMALTTKDVCEPGRPVPVMHIHGTEDPAWRYKGGVGSVRAGAEGKHVSVERTLGEWRTINGCADDHTSTTFRDTADDGQTTIRQEWRRCRAPLIHLKIEGGGHTWPNGRQYFPERRVGPVTRDWGNDVIWEFLAEHRLEE